MPAFGKTSRSRLDSAHPELQRLFNEVVKGRDCSVLCGFRDEFTQNTLFRQKKSKVRYPDSHHNSMPSMAVDVVPYPIDWNDTGRFYKFVGYVEATAERLGIKIRSGSDWDSDGATTDQSFNDLPHFELKPL